MEELRTTGESIQFIVTQMGDEQYGIDIKYVDNIVRMQRTTRVPKVAPYIRGVINLRGEVIPIMNLRGKMELPEVEDTNSTRIMEINVPRPIHSPITALIGSVLIAPSKNPITAIIVPEVSIVGKALFTAAAIASLAGKCSFCSLK